MSGRPLISPRPMSSIKHSLPPLQMHLIVVPSGALTSLPFHVLVTEKPDPALRGMAAYRQAAWLALRHPVTVLTSVASLQALRRLGPSKAREPYIAFGNPLLLGANGNDRRALDKQLAALCTHARGGKARQC